MYSLFPFDPTAYEGRSNPLSWDFLYECQSTPCFPIAKICVTKKFKKSNSELYKYRCKSRTKNYLLQL